MGPVRGKWIAVWLAAACGVLAACSHSTGSGATPFVKRHATGTAGGHAAAPGSVADPGPADLVSAVSAGADAGPVGLKFQLAERPVVGKPVVITLRLIANQPLEHLEARFHPDDGLNVTQGGDFDPEGPMEPGSAVDHALTLVPSHEGVFAVMATVTTGSAAEAVSRSFVIPIVVATDAAPSPQAPPVTPVAAKRK
ncbi:MAG TPA: hypothetical protein VHW25_15305 [Steroidobacteraceae bacterium]|jgi:hypothetical protein|nr:hypothetical protein [Steroidobacteraceae bacterium]